MGDSSPVACCQISKGALRRLGESKCAGVLEDLSLAGCQRIEEPAFLRFAQRTASLHNLNLAGCGSCVTDKMIQTVTMPLFVDGFRCSNGNPTRPCNAHDQPFVCSFVRLFVSFL